MESDGVKRSTTLRHDAPTQVTIVSPTKEGRHGNKRIIVLYSLCSDYEVYALFKVSAVCGCYIMAP